MSSGRYPWERKDEQQRYQERPAVIRAQKRVDDLKRDIRALEDEYAATVQATADAPDPRISPNGYERFLASLQRHYRRIEVQKKQKEKELKEAERELEFLMGENVSQIYKAEKSQPSREELTARFNKMMGRPEDYVPTPSDGSMRSRQPYSPRASSPKKRVSSYSIRGRGVQCAIPRDPRTGRFIPRY